MFSTAHAVPFNATSHPKLVVIAANRLLLSDLDNPSLPNLSKIIHDGSVGLISPNCLGPKAESSVLMTASAGSPCRGGGFVHDFYGESEVLLDGTNAGVAYTIRTGRRAPKGSALFLGLGKAIKQNSESWHEHSRDCYAAPLAALRAAAGQGLSCSPRREQKCQKTPFSKEMDQPLVRLGALGEALHEAGLRTAIVGNADVWPSVQDRAAAVLAMDSHGIIDFDGIRACNYSGKLCGDRGEMMRSGTLGNSMALMLRRADFVVGYFGYSTSLDENKISITDQAYNFHKTEALKMLDDNVADLLRSPLAKNATIIVASFCPPSDGAWNQLTPIIVYPAKTPGLLASPTTRTPGLIGAADFAPTVLKLMHLPQVEDMVGRPAVEIKSDNPLGTLYNLGTRVNTNQKLLMPIGIFFAIVNGIPFMITVVLIALGRSIPRRLNRVLRLGILLCACAPVALLLAVLAPAGVAGYIAGTGVSLVVVAAVSLAVSSLISRKIIRNREEEPRLYGLPVIVVYAITVLIVLIDAFTGSNLCKTAGPSSYQITGMRYYGIGNEYAGLVISMGALAALLIAPERWRKWATALLGALIVVMFGFGSLGANYGATVAAVVTFSLLAISVWRKGFGARHVIGAFGLGGAVVLIFAFADWKLAGAAGSHAARAVGLTQRLGDGYVLTLMLRKALFNLKITATGIGVKVLLGFTPLFIFWFYGMLREIRKLFGRDRAVIAGLKAVLAGMVAAYLLNDSGVVFATMMIGITMLILLYCVLERKSCPES